jgi:hypothetical protein
MMPKQIRTRSAAKKKGAVEFRLLPFDEWRKQFDLLLRVGSSAHEGLLRWIDVDGVAKAAKFSPDECRLHVLEILHDLTCARPVLAEHARKANKHFKDSLKEFVQRIESLTGQIGGSGIFSPQLGLPIFAEELLKSLDSAAEEARTILALIDHPHTRQPKIIDQCLPFFVSMSCSAYTPALTEKQLCALAWLAMRAHGYDDTDLAILDDRRGTARKHAEAYCGRALAVTGMDKEPSGQSRFLFRLSLALKHHLHLAPAAEPGCGIMH